MTAFRVAAGHSSGHPTLALQIARLAGRSTCDVRAKCPTEAIAANRLIARLPLPCDPVSGLWCNLQCNAYAVLSQ
eukprot:1959464-Pyramimonas_sp.AAC.1